MKKVIYGFSGDPITYGHINIIKRALSIFGELIVGIGMNPAKKYFFSLEERKLIAQESLKNLSNVKVVAFRGLLVDYAYENDIKTVIRGIRNSEDLNYELMLHQIGESQKQNIDTIYFPAKQDLTHISSGAVKALQLEQGLIHEYVPLYTKQKLEERISKQSIVAITGEIGVGKSYISNKLKELGKYRNVEVHVIDIDKIGHDILGKLKEPIYQVTRTEIGQKFGRNLLNKDGFVKRHNLGEVIFNSPEKLKEFNELLYKPLLLRLRRELYGRKGLIILDTALISESEMGYLSNNNVVLVSTDRQVQKERLISRGYSEKQIENRMNSQYNINLKEKMLSDTISRDCHGNIWRIDNSKKENEKAIIDLFNNLTKEMKIK